MREASKGEQTKEGSGRQREATKGNGRQSRATEDGTPEKEAGKGS